MAKRLMKKSKAPLSPGRRVLRILFVLLVILAALIVIAYGAFRLLAQPPKITQETPPPAESAGVALADPSPTPSQSAQPVRQRKEYTYTFLLCASDQSSGNVDTMIVATYDTVNQTMAMVSIPRDTLVEGVTAKGKHFYKLCSMYPYNGIDALKEEVQKIVGFPIDFYVKVNTRGFVRLVDAVGGINFNVPVHMSYDDPSQNLYIHFEPGMQYLSGTDALKVARCRKNSDGRGRYPNNIYDAYPDADIGRTKTQRELIMAVLKKAVSQPLNLPTYYDIFMENVETDLKLSDLAFFADKGLSFDFDNVTTTSLPGDGAVTYKGWTWCYELYPDKVLDIVNTSGLNPYTTDITADMLDITQSGTAKRYD
ncbi:LCP family protein [uncultured Flavonifractor sp.]|uniref:LCP family protein n=1 Tax=uncultured Flavonifractor sp. TaxID=1193534 RepID=UPI0026049091|nr:LCP family protein [uncultured Flavonifractor sp.]